MTYQLKKMQHSDSTFIQGLFQDADVMRYIGPVMADDKAQKICHLMGQEVYKKTATYWMIVRTSDEVQLGLTSVHWSDETQTIKLGIMVAVDFQNRGVFKVAQAAAIEQAINCYPVKTFIAYTHKQNLAANHGYKQMGFEAVIMANKTAESADLIKWQADARTFTINYMHK